MTLAASSVLPDTLEDADLPEAGAFVQRKRRRLLGEDPGQQGPVACAVAVATSASS